MQPPDRNKRAPQHEKIASKLADLAAAVGYLERDAQYHLGGVPWDFRKLQDHLKRMAGLIGEGLPLMAYNEHLEFSVSSPGKLMARLRGRMPAHVTRVWAFRAGQKTSERKSAATRLNLERARAVKKRLLASLPPEVLAAREEMKILRRLIRKLKDRENRAAKARLHRRSARAPRKDAGKRAQRLAASELKLRELEARWPKWKSVKHNRGHGRAEPSEAWLIPPVS